MLSHKSDFSIFDHHKELVYLDSAATSQKPKVVIDAIKNYYETQNGSPHRGAHLLSIESTRLYEDGREVVKNFIKADETSEIVFTRNATESLNLIAYGYIRKFLQPEQNIVLSITNHHSNIIPFQRLCHEIGAELRYLYCDDNGSIINSELSKIDQNTLMVSIPMISNGIGIKHDVKKIFDQAKAVRAICLLDVAQSVGHDDVSVKDLEPDLMVFSGHKIFAPQGIGVLYGKKEILELFDPFLSGGDMIEYVEEQSTTYANLPERLEAGTQNVAGVIGLKTAIEYINEVGLENIISLERELTMYAFDALKQLDFIEVYGNRNRGALITFNVKDVHPHDVASILDSHHVAIRAGHHCCQPLMKYLKHPSTCRASFSIFNSKEDVDQLIYALHQVKEVFYE